MRVLESVNNVDYKKALGTLIMNKAFSIIIIIFLLILFESNGFAAGLKLIKSNNDGLCNHIKTIFQGDFDKFGSERFYLHNEYNWVKWVSGEYLLKGEDRPKLKKVKLSIFDINNDGALEVVMLETIMMFAREISELYVIGNSKFNLDKSIEFTVDDLIKLPGIKASSSWPYRLDIESLELNEEFYKRKNDLGFIDIYPFRYQGILYLSLVEKYQFYNQPKWHIVVKYTDKQFPIGKGERGETNVLEHICYFDSIASGRGR